VGGVGLSVIRGLDPGIHQLKIAFTKRVLR
jgi:hypothetical protein